MPTESPGAAAALTVLAEIKAIDQLAHLHLQRALPDELEVSHYSVLNQLGRLGGERTPAQLARAFRVTKGAMTNTIARLQRADLVAVREDTEDRRKKLVSITPRGAEMRRAATASAAPLFDDIAGQLGRDRLAAALPLLRDLRLLLSER